MNGRPATARQDGSSPLGAVFSLMVMLGFVLLASQTMIHLFASSVVNAVAFDAARHVASEGHRCEPGAAEMVVGADDAVRHRLGMHGGLAQDPTLTVACHRHGQRTEVTVTVRSPAQALRVVPGGGMAVIDRTGVARTERWR